MPPDPSNPTLLVTCVLCRKLHQPDYRLALNPVCPNCAARQAKRVYLTRRRQQSKVVGE